MSDVWWAAKQARKVMQMAVLETDVKGFRVGTIVHAGDLDPNHNERNVLMPDDTMRTMGNDFIRLCW